MWKSGLQFCVNCFSSRFFNNSFYFYIYLTNWIKWLRFLYNRGTLLLSGLRVDLGFELTFMCMIWRLAFREPLITNIMWRNLIVQVKHILFYIETCWNHHWIGNLRNFRSYYLTIFNSPLQALYQVIVLLVLNFGGESILRNQDSRTRTLQVKNTIIFNAFVLCQVRTCQRKYEIFGWFLQQWSPFLLLYDWGLSMLNGLVPSSFSHLARSLTLCLDWWKEMKWVKWNGIIVRDLLLGLFRKMKCNGTWLNA